MLASALASEEGFSFPKFAFLRSKYLRRSSSKWTVGEIEANFTLRVASVGASVRRELFLPNFRFSQKQMFSQALSGMDSCGEGCPGKACDFSILQHTRESHAAFSLEREGGKAGG